MGSGIEGSDTKQASDEHKIAGLSWNHYLEHKMTIDFFKVVPTKAKSWASTGTDSIVALVVNGRDVF